MEKMTDTNTARVAIVVRTKDRPQLLRRALASITAQSMPDWEAVIVNDGGDAASVIEVVNTVDPAARERIRVLDHIESLGRWPSANAGVDATTAEFIVLHDDDDSWHPEFLAETTAFLDAHPQEHGVIARADVVLEKYDGDDLVVTGGYQLEDHNPEVLLTDLLDFNRFVPIQFLYRRRLHDIIGPYDASKPAAADWMFNMQVVRLRPIRYVSERALAYWHQRPGVNGVNGNSVFAATGDHRIADRSHRDEALRAYIEADGAGLPLYLAQAFASLEKRNEADRRRVDELEARLSAIEASMHEAASGIAALRVSLEQTIDARVRRIVRTGRARLKPKK